MFSQCFIRTVSGTSLSVYFLKSFSRWYTYKVSPRCKESKWPNLIKYEPNYCDTFLVVLDFNLTVSCCSIFLFLAEPVLACWFLQAQYVWAALKIFWTWLLCGADPASTYLCTCLLWPAFLLEVAHFILLTCNNVVWLLSILFREFNISNLA